MGISDTRIPQQERSIKKKNLIKNSALHLFSTNGYHRTSSNEIAKHAGVSIGTFYSYYKDKYELFSELFLDYYDQCLSQIPEIHIDDESNLVNTIKMYISTIFKFHEYIPEFHKEMNAMIESEEEFRAIDEAANKKMVDKISQLMRKNIEFLRIKDPETSIFIIQKSLESVVHSVKLHKCPHDEQKVINEMTDMICRYVLSGY